MTKVLNVVVGVFTVSIGTLAGSAELLAAESPPRPTIQMAFATTLGCDLSQCEDPQCRAAHIAMGRQQAVKCFLQTFYLEARLNVAEASARRFVQIRDVAVSRSLALEEHECNAKIASATALVSRLTAEVELSRQQLKRLLCLPCSSQLVMPSDMARPELVCGLDDIIHLRCCRSCPRGCRKCCCNYAYCRALVTRCFDDFTRKDHEAELLVAEGVPAAESAMRMGLDGIQPGIGTREIHDAIRVAELLNSVLTESLDSRHRRDLAAFALEATVRRCIYRGTSEFIVDES